MKGKEIDAYNRNTNQRIVERFMEDGTRFMKVTPYDPRIYSALKAQFNGKNVDIQITESKWIVITKTGENKELKEAAKKAYGNIPVDADFVVNAEVEILKKSGFTLIIKEIESS